MSDVDAKELALFFISAVVGSLVFNYLSYLLSNMMFVYYANVMVVLLIWGVLGLIITKKERSNESD